MTLEKRRFPRAGTERPGWRTAAVVTLATLAASWLTVRNRTAKAERDNPPAGRFIEVEGVRLHYLEQGEGPVLLLLHGTVVTADDFRANGLMEQLSRSFRVIAIDRPGFGYSDRPRGTNWTPDAQARLMHLALRHLGADQYLVLAHSWGTLVAVHMALQAPDKVRGLLLLAGYYYPSARLDVPVAAMPAIPVIGDLMRFTVSPLLGRLAWPLAAKGMFSPHEVTETFRREDPWMLLRPGQVRATAEEAALMVEAAAGLEKRYGELQMPVLLMAGKNDRVIDPESHTARLHKDVPHSELTLLPELGHMVQHLAQNEIAAAVNDLAERAGMAAPSMGLNGAAHHRQEAAPPM
jgi:pimeloyl-ACP methyl ester carboxylesterase